MCINIGVNQEAFHLQSSLSTLRSESIFPRIRLNSFSVHFTCKDGKVHFGAEVNEDEVPDITDETQTHCVQCVWQGEYGKLIDSKE